MKNQPCIMMHCIISGDDHTKDQLLQRISNLAQKQWPGMDIALTMYGDYWKYEGSKEIIYSVSYNRLIAVHDFIKIFALTWHYSEGMVSDFDTNVEYNSESAVWNKICHPLEFFLHEKVDWVHIYTWHA